MIDLNSNFTVFRDGQAVELPLWMIDSNDLVRDQWGGWHPARNYIELAPFYPPPPPPPAPPPTPAPTTTKDVLVGLGLGVLAGAAIVGGAILLFKGGQAVLDEDFGTTEFPAWFRREKIDAHVAAHGWHCTKCNCDVTPGSLTVDHIVSLKNRGRTSRMNARVLCLWCNSSKGGRNVPLDYLRGRSS